MQLKIKPITLKTANAFVERYHRHNIATVGNKFSIACYNGEKMVGVAICGRPVSRMLDDGATLEILRNCTDGTRNACSCLYGACVRIARAMGYDRVITYTLISEPGTSLKASGFTDCGDAGGGTWSVPARPRELEQITIFGERKKYQTETKKRWEKLLR